MKLSASRGGNARRNSAATSRGSNTSSRRSHRQDKIVREFTREFGGELIDKAQIDLKEITDGSDHN